MSLNKARSPRSSRKHPPQVPPPHKRLAGSTAATALASALVVLLACCAALLSQRVQSQQAGDITQAWLKSIGYEAHGDGSESLPNDVLHGAWNLTWEVFDRATKHPNSTVLSWLSPRLVLIRDFLSPAEIEHVVKLAEGSFERSEVVSDTTHIMDVRTSDGAWLMGEARDAKVDEIERRIHSLVGIPQPFGESLHVLRYKRGQQYEIHPDYCAEEPGQPISEACREFLESSGGPTCGPGAGGVTCGDRLATFIIYLRSPDKGGATVLPWATNYRVPPEAAVGKPGTASTAASRRLAEDQQPKRADGAEGPEGAGAWTADEEAGSTVPAASPSDATPVAGGSPDSAAAQPPLSGMAEVDGVRVPAYCLEGASTLQVAPPPGSAVLFWDYTPVQGSDLRPGDLLRYDPFSEHVGCPVISGTKLVMTRWIRSTEFGVGSAAA